MLGAEVVVGDCKKGHFLIIDGDVLHSLLNW